MNECIVIWHERENNEKVFYFSANSEALTADAVKTYLVEHPEFLDSYIQQNIHSNTIEQWMSKRPSKIPSTTHPSSSISMPIVSAHKNSLPTSTIKTSGINILWMISIIYD